MGWQSVLRLLLQHLSDDQLHKEGFWKIKDKIGENQIILMLYRPSVHTVDIGFFETENNVSKQYEIPGNGKCDALSVFMQRQRGWTHRPLPRGGLDRIVVAFSCAATYNVLDKYAIPRRRS